MVLSSTKANTKYAFKHKHKQKTRKHLFKRINKRSTYKQYKQYKNKNNKRNRTHKQRNMRGGVVDDNLQKYLSTVETGT